MSDMSEEALRSMAAPAKLIDQSSLVMKPPEVKEPVIDPRTGQPKRGRGRPPGSRNRPKTPELGINPPQRLTVPPSGRRQPLPPTSEDDKERVKQEKKARADQYATWINMELNDRIFMFLIGASGGTIKAEMLYKQGSVPAKAQSNPNLTEMGNAIAIPPDVADSWGKLFAELSYTNTGKSIAKAGENNSIAIGMAALTALFSTYRYAQQLKPIIDSFNKAREAQEQAKEGNAGQGGQE